MHHKFLFCLILLNLCFYTVRSQDNLRGWTQIPGVSVNGSSIYFINKDTGFVASSQGKILRSSNAGLNWSTIYDSLTLNLRKLHFTNNGIGYCFADSLYVLKTTNSGLNWFAVNSGLLLKFESCSFINNTGYVTGSAGYYYKTIDGGLNWTQEFNNDSLLFQSVYFLNDTVGWITYRNKLPTLSNYKSGIYKTTDGGITWNQIYSYLNSTAYKTSLWGINFFDSMTGFVMYPVTTISGTNVLRTTNGGINWNSYPMGYGQYYYPFFLNNRLGWAAGPYSNIAITNDGGSNWNDQIEIATPFQISTVFFTDSLTGYTSAYSKLYKTTNGGILAGFSEENENIPKYSSLLQNYPNPFNPTTSIKYNINKEGRVKLIIFDIIGNEVKIIVNENKQAGYYEIKFDGDKMASGVYFYQLSLNNNIIESKKLVLIK